jgi:hypothetical protein
MAGSPVCKTLLPTENIDHAGPDLEGRDREGAQV